MSQLAKKECVPCQGGVPPLTPEEQAPLLDQLSNWQVIDGHHLLKSYSFSNFADALKATNKIGEIAEAENHHPDLYLSWGKVEVTIWTHKIDGLTESDFILAAKIDESLQA